MNGEDGVRIGVVGCGALGSFYGATLARAGRHHVHFLCRSDFEVVQRQGVEIRGPSGSFRVRPATARRPESIGPCDLVLVGLKTTANPEFRNLIPPLLGAETPVVTLQNGLGNEEALAEVVGAERVMGGLCVVCLNRIAPGIVVHQAYGQIALGEFRRSAGERTARVAGWFREAGIPCGVVDDLQRAHWEKLVWNIPFNGLGVAAAAGYESVVAGRLLSHGPLGSCAPTDRLLGDSRWSMLVRELMDETIAGAAAVGARIDRSIADVQIARTASMSAYKASTLIDFERGLPLEVEALFGEPLRRIRASGGSAPRLDALYSILKELDRRGGP